MTPVYEGMILGVKERSFLEDVTKQRSEDRD
jgi:hypothetical protein